KRPTSSVAKCSAWVALPPLPNQNTAPPARNRSIIASATVSSAAPHSSRPAIIDWCSRISSSKSSRESLDGPATVLEGSNRVILLDRDGVLNVDRVNSVRTVADLDVEIGAIEGCRLLKDAGYPLGVISNQSAVGRGWMTADDLDAV